MPVLGKINRRYPYLVTIGAAFERLKLPTLLMVAGAATESPRVNAIRWLPLPPRHQIEMKVIIIL